MQYDTFKRIENCVRSSSTIAQERLDGLRLISIKYCQRTGFNIFDKIL